MIFEFHPSFVLLNGRNLDCTNHQNQSVRPENLGLSKFSVDCGPKPSPICIRITHNGYVIIPTILNENCLKIRSSKLGLMDASLSR